MSDPKPNPVEDAVDCDAKSSQIRLPKDGGTIFPGLKIHKFWETQPVMQIKDIGDETLPEGPIEPATLVSEVKQEPYNLLDEFEWTTCDMKSDEICSEVYNFFKVQYPAEVVDDFMVHFSREFLMWALCPPGYYQNWHVGVRVKTSKKLVAFISGVPARIRVRDEVISMANINFMCIHKNIRSKRLAPVLIKELTRRVRLQSIWQAAYPSRALLSRPVTTSQYWHRLLNPKKLIDVGYAALRERVTMSVALKLYKVPDAPSTPGFREMERRDVPAVTELLRNYLRQFGVAAYFDENDVKHWLLPRKDAIHTYLVVSPETHDVTDFCSFYTLSLTIRDSASVNPKGPKHKTVECAYSYYNVVTRTSLPKLMNDALTVSKKKGFDIFYALDVMQNASFLTELKFYPGPASLLSL